MSPAFKGSLATGVRPASRDVVSRATPLDIGSGSVDWHLALLLVLSAVGSVIVFCLAAAAFRRRKSLPYLLITAALGALVLRPIVGAGTVLGYVSMGAHHTIEHLLDVVIAGFLIAAIVAVGSLEGNTPTTGESTDRRGQELNRGDGR